MGRSLLGGFLVTLLALALAGAVFAVFVSQRGSLPGANDQRRILERQISDWERWRRDDPDGRRIQPIGAETGAWSGFRADDPWRPDDPYVLRDFLASRPELATYRAWMYQARLREMCPRGVNTVYRMEAGHIDTAELRDSKYLDPFLATRR